MTYLNFVAGAVIMFIVFVPIQTVLYKRDRLQHNGIARPEARFLLSLITVWGFPISLLWFAFTSSGNVSYWSPVIAGGVLGVADPLVWLGILNYITDSYPNVAGSAIAAFLIPSQLLAAGCVHIGTCIFLQGINPYYVVPPPFFFAPVRLSGVARNGMSSSRDIVFRPTVRLFAFFSRADIV